MPAPLIAADPSVMLGKPVIVGTRITVEHILERLAGGDSIDDLLQAHPRLTRAGVVAAIEYAATAVRTTRDEPLGRIAA